MTMQKIIPFLEILRQNLICQYAIEMSILCKGRFLEIIRADSREKAKRHS